MFVDRSVSYFVCQNYVLERNGTNQNENENGTKIVALYRIDDAKLHIESVSVSFLPWSELYFARKIFSNIM